MVPDDEAVIPANIFKQARAAIDEASLLLFVVNAREGITPGDEELARRLRALDKPVFVAANKVNTAKIVDFAGEFHRFGYEDVFPISAEHGGGIGELLDAVIELLPAVEVAERERGEINVAVIGRPNVGKSSLINKLLGEERVIVSPSRARRATPWTACFRRRSGKAARRSGSG